MKKDIKWGKRRVMRDLFDTKTYAKKNFDHEKADGCVALKHFKSTGIR